MDKMLRWSTWVWFRIEELLKWNGWDSCKGKQDDESSKNDFIFSSICIPTGLLARFAHHHMSLWYSHAAPSLCRESWCWHSFWAARGNSTVLLAPHLTCSTVTTSPRLWVKTREERNYLSFPFQGLSDFLPQAFLYPRTISPGRDFVLLAPRKWEKVSSIFTYLL